MTQVQQRQRFYPGLARPVAVGLGAASGNEVSDYFVGLFGVVGSLGGGLWGGLIGAGVGQTQKGAVIGAGVGATLGLVGGLIAGFRIKGSAQAALSSQNTPAPT